MSSTTDHEVSVHSSAPLTEAEFLDRLRALPPSAKLVAKVLELEEPLTHSRLVDETLLPDRTVRYALERLENEDLVNAQISFRDGRKQIYSLRR